MMNSSSSVDGNGPVLVTPPSLPPVGERSIVMSVSVCLAVRTSELRRIFRACCLWPRLGSPLTSLHCASLSLQSSAVEQVLDILNEYPVLGNSRGDFPLPSSWFVITYCDESFPSPWHCLSAALSLSGATLLSTLEGVPLSATWGRGWSP